MFFLIRSAVCIGLVAYLLPNVGSRSAMHDLAADSQATATAGLTQYCATRLGCPALGAKVAGWAIDTGKPGETLRHAATIIGSTNTAALLPLPSVAKVRRGG